MQSINFTNIFLGINSLYTTLNKVPTPEGCPDLSGNRRLSRHWKCRNTL